MYEIVGLAASSFVLLSFLLKGEKKIRIINSIGCFVFIIYGILINALSVWLLNSITLIVQIVRIIQMSKRNQGGKDD